MDRLLDGLTEHQRLAVTTNAINLRILAGAGSGKTRVLTHRIAHQAHGSVIDADHTLALTFTRKAAGELRGRLRALGLDDTVAAGTFHAQAYAQLRARWADRGVRPPELLDRRGRILFRLLPRSLSRADRLGVMAEIDWAAARRIGPAEYPSAAEGARRRPPVLPTQIAEYMRAFADEKARRRMVDFDDLLELCIRDLSDPEYAATRHWRFRHLFVDEFQDVNPLQFDLLRSWLGSDSTLCVVGDPNQAIYSWNGADASYLIDFATHFPGASTVELTDNFRSTPQILEAAAAVLGTEHALTATRPAGPLPSVRRCDNEFHEARAIARKLRDRHRPGTSWADQAVLVRTNAQTTLIADALRKSHIPVAIKAGASILDDPRIADRLRELANTPTTLAAAATDLRMETRAADDEARDALGMLANLADDQLALQPDATSADFVAWVRATVGADDTAAGGDAVDVVTFHAAKGLQWPIVHIAGVEDGLVPIGRAKTPEALAEEVRLFYVAVTRAENELYCTWAASRRFGERSSERSASPYLLRIQGRSVEPSPTSGRRANVAAVRKVRQSLGVEHMDPAQLELREKVRRWRRDTARATGVPAYVVFPDKTLDALVTHRPTSHEELAQMPGLGAKKLARYGDNILALLAEH